MVLIMLLLGIGGFAALWGLVELIKCSAGGAP